MVTTIKVSDNTKQKLDSLKTKSQTYDEIVQNLVSKHKKTFLAEEYKKKYNEETAAEKKEFSEWEKIE